MTAPRAWLTLIAALVEVVDSGGSVPCLADPQPFTSETRDDRSAAAAACRACPALLACAAAALAGDERFGVWAGVDLTPRPGPSNRTHEQLVALLEGAASEAQHPPAEIPSESPGPVVRPCEECGSAFVAKTKRARFCGGACRTRANRADQTGGPGSRRVGSEGRKTAAVRRPTPDRNAVTVTAAPSQTRTAPSQTTTSRRST